jgi:hypothetical protein
MRQFWFLEKCGVNSMLAAWVLGRYPFRAVSSIKIEISSLMRSQVASATIQA